MRRCIQIFFGMALTFFAEMAIAVDPTELCKSFAPEANCEKRTEQQFVEPPKGSVIYSESSLKIIPKNGVAKQYEVFDRDACEKCPNHSVKYDQAHKFFWVTGEEYESGYIELVSYETGQSYKFEEDYEIVNTIAISPDGNLLLVDHKDHANRSLTINLYSTGRIEKIRTFDAEDFSKLKSIDFRENGTAVWFNSNEIGLIHWNRDKWKYDSILARIKKLNNKWEIVIEPSREQ